MLTVSKLTTRCIADGRSPAFSPDNRQIAYSIGTAIVISDLNGNTLRTLSVRGENPHETVDSPAWSPDGRKLVFIRSELVAKYEHHLYTVNVDGSGLRQFSFGEQAALPDWQPVTR